MNLKKNHLKKGLPEYSYLGCPLTANRTPWCFRICQPNEQDKGRCGRLAPHSLKSYTQQAIEDHNRKKCGCAGVTAP